MKKVIFLLLTLSAHLQAKTYFNLGQRAVSILQNFQQKQVKSNFGERLFYEIQQVTEDFTCNVDFESLEKYIDRDYLDYLSFCEAQHNTSAFIALIWPVTVGHDALIESIFEKYCHIISYKRIMLNRNGAKNLLSQIETKASHPTGVDLWFQAPYLHTNPMRVYLIECKPSNVNYVTMRHYLVGIFSHNKSFIDVFEKKYGKKALENLYVTTKCKREIRQAVKIPYAMHINDTHEETKEIAKLVFNPNTVEALNFLNPKACKKFNRLHTLLSQFVACNKQYVNKIIAYNSAVLSAFGLRECSDIDFLHDPRVRLIRPQMPDKDLEPHNEYFKRGYVILEDYNGKTYILEDCPQVFPGVDFWQSNTFKIKVSIDELLCNPHYHFYLNGIKYVSLDFMLYFKKSRGRPKDLRDVQLIQDHFRSRYN